MTLNDIYKAFPNEASCIKLLEEVIWNNLPSCPYCKSNNYIALKNTHRYHCNKCNTSYSVTVKTIFHKTKTPLQIWLYAIYLKEINELNIPVRKLGEEMQVTKDTANRIVNKVNNFFTQNRTLYTSIFKKLIK